MCKDGGGTVLVAGQECSSLTRLMFDHNVEGGERKW